MARPAEPSPEFDYSLLVNAAPTRVLAAFFDPHALSQWWQAVRSVTTPRPMGVYAIEWAPTADGDDILGRLGGVFHGRVMEYLPGRELFVADAWWLPTMPGIALSLVVLSANMLGDWLRVNNDPTTKR